MQKLTIALIVILLIHSISASAFNAWKETHQKTYAPDEESLRFNIWKKNSDFIERHNKLYDEGVVTYRLAMNQFGDLTNEEFKIQLLRTPRTVEMVEVKEKYSDSIPDKWDWREKGIVPPVKDQGQCGADEIFSESDAVMCQLGIGAGHLVTFDLAQLEACLQQGCSGMPPFTVYQYLMKCGIAPGSTPSKCNYDSKNANPVIDGYTQSLKGDEKILANNVYTKGPHSIGFDSGNPSFQFYSSGVYYESSCSPNDIDHEMLLIGYGTQGNNDFWLVQNSWGTSWGMQGYILTARNRKNNCGIASLAAVPRLGNSTFHPDNTCFGKFS